MAVENWLEYEIFGDALAAWATAAFVFVAVWLVLSLVRRLIGGRLRALAERRGGAALRIAEDASRQTRAWFLFLVAVLLASRLLELTPRIHSVVETTVSIALLLQIGLWASAAVKKGLSLRRERQLGEGRETVAALDVLGFVLRVAVWSILFLVMLDNLGLDVTALIAGLGIGGVAVALAIQNILGDLFASLSIVLDKPFVVGDFLAVGDYLGSVEKIGIKTTRLRSLSGEQLVFSNNDLLSSRIRNYGRMYERRVAFTIGVDYDTPTGKLERIPVIIREAVDAQENARFDRAHFQKYGPWALLFEVVYYVTSADYNLYVAIEQNINLVIHGRFAAEGIRFARTTRLDVGGIGEAGEEGARA